MVRVARHFARRQEKRQKEIIVSGRGVFRCTSRPPNNVAPMMGLHSEMEEQGWARRFVRQIKYFRVKYEITSDETTKTSYTAIQNVSFPAVS